MISKNFSRKRCSHLFFLEFGLVYMQEQSQFKKAELKGQEMN